MKTPTNTIAKSQIEEWKAEFGHVYKTSSGGTDIIYRPVRRSEYTELMKDTEIPIESEEDIEARAKRLQDRQDGLCKIAVLYPENIDEILEALAGLASNLSSEIMDHSGFDALSKSEEL